MDSNVTPDIVKERIKMLFLEAKEDLQKGVRNSVFLYFSGHGVKKALMFKDGVLSYSDMFDAIREGISAPETRVMINIQLVIDACYSSTLIDLLSPDGDRNEIKKFSDLAKSRQKDFVIKIMCSCQSKEKSYDLKIERGGAFTEWIFGTTNENREYWKKKWFGRVENPQFTHESKPQKSKSMDAWFLSDGSITIKVDNKVVFDEEGMD